MPMKLTNPKSATGFSRDSLFALLFIYLFIYFTTYELLGELLLLLLELLLFQLLMFQSQGGGEGVKRHPRTPSGCSPM